MCVSKCTRVLTFENLSQAWCSVPGSLQVYVYIYICMYILYIYAEHVGAIGLYRCVYIYVYMHACVYACMYVCMHACMYVYTDVCIHTFVCMYACIYMHVAP